ncbi:uncharacterized protein MONOS_10084 [Monocercomonoides exilis]|uniref:uncharacterized protein n=1 Tax=Monocercomonoides exilis TaxID=2049356 RepID=UPI0035596CF4|nr:hypothetical protein MONOS_10084 [Monocercomonoides exilis]|eukprot:MONOS_10084.1-p1 / transcript=MONOS_10084.1 / gene=MONOS_10084 / organism=Monocercomonoides_exilis_PA203 / gene_product=unspecified product / transcript_product=unspecified product / location=Mono_scaffold00443:4294-5370(-) / protein_length=359 / sequence_SO=supercontig / SO=protein_coding / is_pseudo=false
MPTSLKRSTFSSFHLCFYSHKHPTFSVIFSSFFFSIFVFLSLTQLVKKLLSIVENVLAYTDEANEMHKQLVVVCWRCGAELMFVMVQLARERERAGEVAEERTQLVGEAVEVMWVMLEELRVRGFVKEVRWKMLWLLRVRLVIAVWLRVREPAVRKKRGVVIDDEDRVVPVMAVVLRLREGEFSERWKRMGVMGFVELWAMARAETVREPWVCWKRADEADGSGEEEDVDIDENEEEAGWGMPLEEMVVVVPFPVIFVLGEMKMRVWVRIKVDMRRVREASWNGINPLSAYSIVAHGPCCVLSQASTSLPPFATILFWLMIGSQSLYTAFSACPLLYTLFVGVVGPHCWNGDWVISLP